VKGTAGKIFQVFRSAFAVHVLNYKAAKMKSQEVSVKK